MVADETSPQTDETSPQTDETAPSGEQSPTTAPVVTPAAPPVEMLHVEFYRRVHPGDTWETIAEACGVAVEVLHALNADRPHFSERSLTVNQDVRVG